MTSQATGLVDVNGQPLRRELLTREVAGPAVTGVRSPIAGYPTDGLTPTRLADILRQADQGEPLEYFEMAELIEERDLHYAGVLATRKRSVAQIDITVEAASDKPEDVQRADLVREWLNRDELADEVFDMMDAVGKQISFTEIVWDLSEGQYFPKKLEWRDPRWFTFDRRDLKTPMLRGGIDGYAVAERLPAFKFITTQIKAKSGLPVRSGIARIAAWAWMFKAFTQRDWAIFTQTYGQPIRIGKFHEGATKEDRATLFRAVANIAGDCAAIVPESMNIEFIEAKNVTAGSELYEKRADWLDRQVSKAILGQTTTTDAISGGHAVSQEHRQVQEDIETADCKSLAAAINRDLIRPWMDLEFGAPANGRGSYPRVVIARPKQEDLKQLTESLAALVPLGLKVQQSEVRDKLGLSDPEAGSDVLQARVTETPPSIVTKPQPAPVPEPTDEALQTALQAEESVRSPAAIRADKAVADMLPGAVEGVAAMAETIGAMLEKASDLEEFRAMLSEGFADINAGQLSQIIAAGLATSHAAGRFDAHEESHGAEA